MVAVQTKNLSYVYSPGTPFEKKAIDDINIEIQKGELVGVIGHTGSGKSTLMSHLNGLVKPTTGQVLIDGIDIWAEPKKIRDFRFKVGLVFQYPEHQLFEETVYKDIAFGPSNMGLGEAEIKERVLEAASYVGVEEEWLEKSPFELSGGQKRRVAIAGVLAMKPSVLILDEPTAGLDPLGRDMILSQIKKYHKNTGSTVLLISHSMEDIANYASKVLVMNDSKLFAYGTVDEVFSRSGELASMGLTVPSVNRIMQGLRGKGIQVDTDLYTVDDAARYLIDLLQKGGAAGA